MNPLPQPSVTAIVLNWNNAADTMTCLESLMHLEYPACHVLVVDNGSQGNSVTEIEKRFPQVPVLELGENLGYAGGNNRGIEHALHQGSDYVWLLNDDVTVAPDTLSALINVALSDPQAGFLGPKVYMRENPQCILSAGGFLDNSGRAQHRGIGERDVGQFDQTASVDSLSGCALLVSRGAIEAVGALDTDFFAYCEDVEWCYRGQKAGFGLVFVPHARVWHPDTRSRDANSLLVTYYLCRNHLLFAAKHRLGARVLLKNLATYLYRILSWTIRPKWRHKRQQRNALLRAVFDFGRGQFGRAGWLA